MNDIAIRVENLRKRYRIGQRERYKALRDVVTDTMYAPFRRLSSFVYSPSRDGDDRRPTTDEWIWALKEVSFQVKRGEVVGIIGRNGAGKSTTLKILSRITKPTEGYVEIHGQVGSLLDVGTGFHPELTGRENIYLNGAILGMKKAEIDRKFDEIVAFAETEKFLDTPVKRYSSGMRMRLAFAVAAHLEPEILVVDEVLAVGDAAFQKKCLGKMGDVAKEGRTVLFVSHNMMAVESLCGRAIWLHEGQIEEEGQAGQVVSRYLQTSFSSFNERVWNDKTTSPGNNRVRLHRACVRPVDGSSSDPITVRTPFVMEFEYWNLVPGTSLSLCLQLYNSHGMIVCESGPGDETLSQDGPLPAGLFRDSCYFPGDLLNDGMYRVLLYILKNQSVAVHKEDNILMFDVRDSIEKRGGWYGDWPGIIRPSLEWRTELVKTMTGESHQKPGELIRLEQNPDHGRQVKDYCQT